MEKINKEKSGYQERPIKIVQFGEGNFLRAFVDYMVDAANRQGKFNGNIAMLKPTPVRPGSSSFQSFADQECQYTVILRGKQNGKTVNKKQIVSSVEELVSIYDSFDRFLELARLESVRFVVSNTTEAGIAFDETDQLSDNPPRTYPAKLTRFLLARFEAFHADAKKGLIVLPVELIEDNGAVLREYVLRYAKLWKVQEGFAKWIEESCVFCNTLVDRIVPGYPKEEAEEIWQELGYEDRLLDVAEIFGLWVIEKKGSVQEEFPLDAAGMPVLFTENVKPYKQRKVRILNGAHTSFVLASFLMGHDHVLQSMQDETVRNYLMKVLYEEVLPTLTLPADEVKEFAEAVIERFENPFVKHMLLSIALNSVSKWRERCMPSLLAYQEKYHKLPKHLTFSLAALMQFYSSSSLGEGALIGERVVQETAAGKGGKRDTYQIKDDEAVLQFFMENSSRPVTEFVRDYLAQSAFHGQDLNEVPGLCELVTEDLIHIRTYGMRCAMEMLDA